MAPARSAPGVRAEMQPGCRHEELARHEACIGRGAMASGDQQPSVPPAELRRQEAEFYEALTAVLAAMPRGTTVAGALASKAGQRLRTKWMLKYGRQPPL